MAASKVPPNGGLPMIRSKANRSPGPFGLRRLRPENSCRKKSPRTRLRPRVLGRRRAGVPGCRATRRRTKGTRKPPSPKEGSRMRLSAVSSISSRIRRTIGVGVTNCPSWRLTGRRRLAMVMECGASCSLPPPLPHGFPVGCHGWLVQPCSGHCWTSQQWHTALWTPTRSRPPACLRSPREARA